MESFRKEFGHAENAKYRQIPLPVEFLQELSDDIVEYSEEGVEQIHKADADAVDESESESESQGADDGEDDDEGEGEGEDEGEGQGDNDLNEI